MHTPLRLMIMQLFLHISVQFTLPTVDLTDPFDHLLTLTLTKLLCDAPDAVRSAAAAAADVAHPEPLDRLHAERDVAAVVVPDCQTIK